METEAVLDRRAELIDAAYGLIAERGLAGLRTADVTARAGVPPETLRQHFATRDELLAAVVDHTVRVRIIGQVPTSAAARTSPLWLALDSLRAAARRDPVAFAVLSELGRNAQDDPAVREALQLGYQGWRAFLVSAVAAGIRTGSIRADADADAIATLLITLVLGVPVHAPVAPVPDWDERMLDQLEQLLAPAP